MTPLIIDVEAVAIADVDTYLEPVSAPSNYKDEAKIAEYIRERRAELAEKAALDVDLARIIAIGMKWQDGRPADVYLLRDYSEDALLAFLWKQWNAIRYEERQLVTFNGLGYDVPLLLRRSMYLDVPAPQIQCDRFKHPQVTDLMAILSMDGKLKYHGLQFYLQRFGYPKAGTDITGAEVAERYAAGDWDAIENHCRMDVEATAWLGERMGVIPKREPAGAF